MEERLARIETKMDIFLERAKAFEDTRDKVNAIEARAKGAWFVITIFSGVVSFVSTLVMHHFNRN